MSNDLQSLVPASCTAVFPRAEGGAPTGDVYPVVVTLTSLGLSQYAGITGHTGTRVLHSAAIADFSGGSAVNASEISSLAAQMATDWYRWQLGRVDEWLAGACPWTPDGYHDIEFDHTDRLATHVARGPWNDCDDSQLSASSAGSLPPGNIIQNLYVTNLYTGGGPKVPRSLVTGVCHPPVLDAELTTDAEINTTSNVPLIVETVTLAQAGQAIVTAIFNWHADGTSTAGNVFTGVLNLNTADIGTDSPSSKRPLFTVPNATWKETQSHSWLVNLIAGTNTLTLNAKRLSGAGLVFASAYLIVNVTSIFTQRQLALLPAGTEFGAADCVADATDCCEGGGDIGTGPGGSGPDSLPCGKCTPETPYAWLFTASEFVLCKDGDPNDCAFTLDQFDGCAWYGTCNGVGAELQIESDGGMRKWVLTIAGMVYTLTEDTPGDCCSPITLTLATALNDFSPCADAPDTITLFPLCPSDGGGGGGPPDVSVLCCPDDLIPSVFVLTFSNGDSATVYYDGVTNWVGPGTICGHIFSHVTVTCHGDGSWSCASGISDDGLCTMIDDGVNDVTHCAAPFALHFTGATFTCCGPLDIGVGGGSDVPPPLVITTCCPDGLPATLNAVITNVSGCACLASTYKIAWVSAYKMWVYTGLACTGKLLTIELECLGSFGSPVALAISIVCDGVVIVSRAEADLGATCSPLSLHYTNGGLGYSVTGCCTGTITVAVS